MDYIKHTRWSETELAILRADYPSTETALIAKQLGRPSSSIRRKAVEEGISKLPQFKNVGCKGRKPEKPLPAMERGKPEKDLEKKDGLASKLRALPFMHPLRRAYDRATMPGTPAGSAPRTMAQLQSLIH